MNIIKNQKKQSVYMQKGMKNFHMYSIYNLICLASLKNVTNNFTYIIGQNINLKLNIFKVHACLQMKTITTFPGIIICATINLTVCSANVLKITKD